MNLFFDPSVTELQKLINKAEHNKTVHDVVVDYDGEVLIDPQLERPELDLNKFKFRIQLSELSKKTITSGSNRLKYLFLRLLIAWDNNDYSGASVA